MNAILILLAGLAVGRAQAAEPPPTVCVPAQKLAQVLNAASSRWGSIDPVVMALGQVFAEGRVAEPAAVLPEAAGPRRAAPQDSSVPGRPQ